MEYYYKAKHNDYLVLPPFLPDCKQVSGRQLELIYPEQNARIYVPKEVTGQKGKTIFTATHTNTNAILFWHLDEAYIGTTKQFHQMALNPTPGLHTITIVDNEGETITRNFEILEK